MNIILRFLIYLFFFFIKIVLAIFFYSLLFLVLNGPINLVWLYIITFLSLFIKYFIPVYFILYFILKLKIFNEYNQDLNNDNTNKLQSKHPISSNIKNFFLIFTNVKFFIINYMCKYKYLFTCIYIFILCLLLNFYKNKIFFFLIIFFILVLFLLYYIYNILNKSNKFKVFFEKNIIYLNIGFILGVICILKMDNDLYIDTHNNERNFAHLIYKISLPRWSYKNAYPDLYPQYKKDIAILSEGLTYYDLFLRDKYLMKYKNLLNLNNDLFLKNINKNYEIHKVFIQSADLNVSRFFRRIYAVDNFKENDIYNYKSQQYIYNSYLFDLYLNKNKSYNCALLHYFYQNKIFYKWKGIYANSFLKELGISKNLIVNTNLKNNFNIKSIKHFDDENIFWNAFNYNLNTFLDYKEFKVNNLDDNLCLSIIRDRYLNNSYFLFFKNEYMSENFFNIDFSKIFNYHIFDNPLDEGLTNNFKIFIDNIFINNVKNKYIFDYEEIKLIDPSNSYYLKLLLNNKVKNSDIESFIKYMHIYFKSGETIEEYNILSLFSNLFIELFNNKRLFYDWLSDLKSKEEIIEKDKFNFFRNYKNNLIYLFSKDERNLDVNVYDEFKKNKIHYERASVPKGSSKDTLLSHDDVRYLYSRYINFNKYFEIFMNSYLWLSLEDSNIKLENYEFLSFLNEYLEDNKHHLDYYFEKYAARYDPNFKKDLSNFNDYSENLENHFNEVFKYGLKIKEEKKKEQDDVFLVKQIFRLNNFIKNVLFNDIALLYPFLNEKNSYVNSMMPPTNYIFFDKYGGLANINYDIYNNIKINFNNLDKMPYKIPDSYRSYLLFGSFFDFISKNKGLYRFEDLDYFAIYDKIDKSAYMSDDDLFIAVVKADLKLIDTYLFNFDISIKDFFFELERVLFHNWKRNVLDICTNVDQMFTLLINLFNNKMFNNEALFRSQINQVCNKFKYINHLLDNMSNTSEHSLKNLVPYAGTSLNSFYGRICLLNYEYVSDYVRNNRHRFNEVDLLEFESNLKNIKTLNKNISKMLESLDILCEPLDYITPEVYKKEFTNTMSVIKSAVSANHAKNILDDRSYYKFMSIYDHFDSMKKRADYAGYWADKHIKYPGASVHKYAHIIKHCNQYYMIDIRHFYNTLKIIKDLK